MRITSHAISRYRERIAPLSEADVRTALDTPAIRLAIQFGAPYVRLGSGHRVVIDGEKVVTILPPECQQWRLGTPKEIS